MAETKDNQIRRILVLWLLFSTGNSVDEATWDSKIKPLISGNDQLPPGIKPDQMLQAANENAVALSRAVGSFKAYSAPASFMWGGGTSCPSLDVILSMLPQ